MFIGDFNLPGIDWNMLHSDNPGENVFLKVVQDRFLTQHVDFPTQDSGNTLDLVLSSTPELVLSVQDFGTLGKSDHRLLQISITGLKVGVKTKELVPDWSKADVDGLKASFSSIKWEDLLRDKTGTESWNLFKQTIDLEVERAVPKKLRRSACKPLWMTRKCMRLIRKKRRLWRWYARNGGRDFDSFMAYKKVQKEVQNAVKKARRNFEQKLAKDKRANSKAFFSHIKKTTSNRVSVGPLKEGDRVVSDSKEMASMLNDFFCSVFTEEAGGDLPAVECLFTGADPLDKVEFTASQIKSKLLQLKESAAPGPDMLWPRVLKCLADVLSDPLALIYTRCLEEGTVPADWKRANITPIYKKGSKGQPGNYRPVSLTSVLCKVMESIIRDSIVAHLSTNDLIRNSQHGFMSGRSCLTNLLEYLEAMTKLLDSGRSVDIVYLDFAKAFDKVPINRLIAKCRGLGITGRLLSWINEWLSNREQRVVLNGECSDWQPVRSGVPQGSVLGPTLFLIYINDIDTAVDFTGSVLKKFADDTKWAMVIESEEDRSRFQLGLDNLMGWSKDWQMLFNVSKCHVIHAGRGNQQFEYFMGGRILETVESEKDFGVLLHKSFRPSLHCAMAAKKANMVFGQLSRGVSFRDRVTFIGLYKTFVRPHLE